MRKNLLINGFMVEATVEDRAVEDIFLPMLRRWQLQAQQKDGRLIVFLAAPPATGKSTLAAFLQELSLQMRDALPMQMVGMDGFHYPQAYISTHTVRRGGENIPMQRLKGTPESFDVQRLRAALEALRVREAVRWPVYDRRLHDVVEDALCITAPIVLVEGNYLLLNQPFWRELPHDDAVFITAEEAFLRNRLLARKMRGGASEEEALAHYEACDGPNVRLCLTQSLTATQTLRMTGDGVFEVV